MTNESAVKTQFTEGPWQVVVGSDGGTYICLDSSGGDPVAEVTAYARFGDADANANLIAAAPDLYMALDQIRSLLESGTLIVRPGLTAAQAKALGPIQLIAALAKARGE